MKDSLPSKEKAILTKLQKSLKVKKRKTQKQLVVGLVGLIGSGKSDVAEKLAPKLGATVIESLDIFRALQKAKCSFEHKRHIERLLGLYVLEMGGSAIFTSDHIDLSKRQTIEHLATAMGADYEFVRIHNDIDVALGNITNEAYGANNFFKNVESAWKGSKKGEVVKVREMMRRIPHHYIWDAEGGGVWSLKPLVLDLCCEIDTTTPKSLANGVKICVERLGKR